MVAGERLLVEERPVAADERPMHRLDDGAPVVLDRQADVEHLAVVVHIRVVPKAVELYSLKNQHEIRQASRVINDIAFQVVNATDYRKGNQNFFSDLTALTTRLQFFLPHSK